MSIKISYLAAAAALSAVIAMADNGSIEIRDGVRPATPETAATGNVLATLAFAADAFADPAQVSGNAVAAANTITPDSAADASGTASWFRIYDSSGTAIWDGDVAVSGSDLNLITTSIVAGQPVQINSFTLTHPV